MMYCAGLSLAPRIVQPAALLLTVLQSRQKGPLARLFGSGSLLTGQADEKNIPLVSTWSTAASWTPHGHRFWSKDPAPANYKKE